MIPFIHQNNESIESFLARIRDESIEFVNFTFTDMLGRSRRLCYQSEAVTCNLLAGGIPFDGSSLPGWCDVASSDMLLAPDLTGVASIFRDPFTAHPTLVVLCDVMEATATQSGYALDPRMIARRAEEYLRATNIADRVYIGPELEFFVFDHVTCCTDPHHMAFSVSREEERAANSLRPPTGDMGHYINRNSGYMAQAPYDTAHDMRSEMLSVCRQISLPVIMHLHEVAAGQHELGLHHHELVVTADRVQHYKSMVHQVARSYGKTATFMPKPMVGCNGSGMHVHQSLWKGDTPLFYGSCYAELSDIARYYMGGIMKHARALNALVNPTTNSYKRLVPGYEAPVYIAYGQHNRSASIRIPFATSPAGRRIETRFPDPSANPYIAFAALLMAGIDGIRHKIDPGEPADGNMYQLSAQEQKTVPHLAASFDEALDALEADHAFLCDGDVFPKEYVVRYLNYKRHEAMRVHHVPHPMEYALYYSV